MNRSSLLLSALVLFAVISIAEAKFVFNDFSDVSNLTLNGNATTDSSDRLVVVPDTGSQRGTVFHNMRQPIVAGFNTTFTIDFDLEANTTNGGADGMLLVIHNDPRGTTALGAGGGARGYSGSGSIVNSAALGFQTWTSDDTEIYTGGSTSPQATVNSGFSGEILDYEVTASWDPASQLLSIDHANLGSPLTYSVDLPAVVGDHYAYVGFSAGTGGGFADHRVQNWTFQGVLPEPGTMLIWSLLAGLGCARRWRRR